MVGIENREAAVLARLAIRGKEMESPTDGNTSALEHQTPCHEQIRERRVGGLDRRHQAVPIRRPCKKLQDPSAPWFSGMGPDAPGVYERAVEQISDHAAPAHGRMRSLARGTSPRDARAPGVVHRGLDHRAEQEFLPLPPPPRRGG